MQLDLTVYQLLRVADQEYTQIPGVMVERASRSTHRHRQSDLLAMQIVLDGEHTFTGEDIQNLLEKASGTFFHTQGSVTRAILSVIEELNKDLYSYNAEWGYDGKQALASINICVVHNGWLFIGQVGNAHLYRIGPNVYDLYGESGETIEKIGVSKRVHPRFYQCEIIAGDMLLMSPLAHGSWKAYYLSTSHEISIDQLKRRLHNQMIQDFSVVVLKFQEGSGLIRNGKWDEGSPVETTAGSAIGLSKPISEIPKTQEPLKSEEIAAEAFLESEEFVADENVPLNQEVPDEEWDSYSLPISEGETENIAVTTERGKVGIGEEATGSEALMRSIARSWMKGKTTRAKTQLFISRWSRKLFPGKNNNLETADKWQPFAAILMPAAVIISSILIYSNFGKEEQYNSFMDLAREKSAIAESVPNKSESKAIWEDVLSLAADAEKYRVTGESRQLFLQAQSILDGMDLATRLSFRPAMTQPFPDGAQITRIKDGTSGIYLLDDASGNVLRVFVNTKGFLELDGEFKCTPGQYGLVDMGKVVDFVILPANEKGYKVMAVDASGDLLYCQPGNIPYSRTLTVPEGGWGMVSNVIFSEKRLIITDTEKNNIWIYESLKESNSELDGIVFVETPTSFFDEDIPDIGGVIRPVINPQDLFLLHEDGHMTLCQYGYEDVGSTTCEDPVPFTDDRISSENKKPWIFMGTHFIEMDHAALPNQSIYILDDVSGTIFQFSMQLNLERTLKPQTNPDFPLPQSAPTGFGILSDQEVLLAFGNQLFTAPLQ